MKLSKIPMQLIGLGALGIFLVSCAGCQQQDFDWEPRPYVGISETESLINSEGETVLCSQPLFDTFTCFDSANIAELRTAIGQVSNSKEKSRLLKALKAIDTSVYYSKQNRLKFLNPAQ